MTELTPERQLTLVSRAWGKRTGYVFFPWIKGTAKSRKERVGNYHEGPPYEWPGERAEILEHLRKHSQDDVYFCPTIFDGKNRVEELARDEKALWADLDIVNPDEIEIGLRPTIAWETSPGRYQALWILNGVLQGASWAGKENHRLTSYLGADPSGWDTTQLLRLPGWRNHKYDDAPRGKLLWSDGPRHDVHGFDHLPELDVVDAELILDDEVEAIDRHAVWSRVRLKVSSEIRALVRTRTAAGDRSAKLWQIERELADAGCTAAEIVAVVRETVWNKFSGRTDELRRLKSEAGKAIAARPKEVQDEIETERETKPEPVQLFAFIKAYKPPTWLIKDIWAQGSCGFIAGQPKSFKSWMALDMAFAVATGTPFLGYFDVHDVGPVLYVQEEDSAGTVKVRSEKVWRERIRSIFEIRNGAVYARTVEGTKVEGEDIPLDAYVGNGLVISDEDWQSWLAEQVEKKAYKLVVLDPLMMIAGDVEEFRAQAMTESVFKPLKQIAREHGCAICVVHHMRKGQTDDGRINRGGQQMLGSVANHAWSDDSLYVTHGKNKDMRIERESKHAVTAPFTIQLEPRRWAPVVTMDALEEDENVAGDNGARRNPKVSANRKKVLTILREAGEPLSATQVADLVGRPYQTIYQHLIRLRSQGMIRKNGKLWLISREVV